MTLRIQARRLVASALTIFPKRLSGVSVLVYHSVASAPGFITDSSAAFERQMRFIKENGFHTVFASEVPDLLARGDIANTVCVTLDDGYQDNYTNVFPVLKRLGIKATIFLITGLVGKSYTDSHGTTRSMLSEAQIREMAASGAVEFMPHSHTHTELDSLHGPELEKEIAGSRSEIERLTGKSATVFAYPRGIYNEETVAALKHLGFSAAFGIKGGIVRSTSNLYDLPRNALGDISDAELCIKLSDRLGSYLALKNLL